MQRRKKQYFEQESNAPNPIAIKIKRRVAFNETDPMAIVWHGRYPVFFEDASAALGKKCGLSYEAFFKANLRVPIVQFHIDYFRPLFLDEEFTVIGKFIWNDGARINTEFEIIKEDKSLACTGYTVQMFINATTQEPLITVPKLLEGIKERWIKGAFNE